MVGEWGHGNRDRTVVSAEWVSAEWVWTCQGWEGVVLTDILSVDWYNEKTDV